MNRREQIILGATLAAALYGVYEFVGPSLLGGPDSAVEQAGFDLAKIQEITSVLEKDKELHDVIAINLKQAGEPWRPDAFHHRRFVVDSDKPVDIKKDQEAQPLDPGKFSYSGYLLMGDEAIAIINGIDYKQGEFLDDYRIEIILPEMTTLSSGGQTFLLPLKGETDDSAPAGETVSRQPEQTQTQPQKTEEKK